MKLSSAAFLALFAALSTAESCSYKSDDYGVSFPLIKVNPQ